MKAGRSVLGVAARRAVLAGLAALAVAGLVACGGGTTSERKFKPDRVLAFGDELSVLTSEGKRFGVNALKTADDSLDCLSNPVWVQTVATAFGYFYAECNPDGSSETKAFMRATLGAKVDDLKAQIDNQLAMTGAGGGVKANDLATVLAGANDILELYGQYPTRSEAELTAEARARGERLAAQVNRLIDLGAKVIVSTVPDMGLTPYALTEKANNTGTDRAALISRLTAAFNGRVRVNIVNDGRYVGLVLADELIQTMAAFPASYGLTDAVTGVCTVALPNCTTKTVAVEASSGTFLWADNKRMAATAQSTLGTLGATRALNNPF